MVGDVAQLAISLDVLQKLRLVPPQKLEQHVDLVQDAEKKKEDARSEKYVEFT